MKVFTIFLLMLFSILNIQFIQEENYINIPGTNIQIIPPSSFKLSPLFLGFEDESGSVIIATPSTNISFAEKLLLEKKANVSKKIISEETLKMNNGEAVLLNISTLSEGKPSQKWILLLTENNQSIKLEGIPASTADESVIINIKNALLTTKLKTN